MTTYSNSLKEKMVLRMTGPRGISATELAREVDIPQPTLSRWLREATVLEATPSDETSPSASRPPALPDPPATHRTPSAEDKLRLVAQSVALGEQELGAMLRREGIHAAQLEQWRAEMLAALAPKARVTATEPTTARPEDRRRLQHLERELERKDKALAEAAALLLLQKKVRDFLGDEDNATTRGRGR